MIWNNYQTGKDAASAMLMQMIEEMDQNPLRIFHLALSGGNTAKLLFEVWRQQFSGQTPWLRIHFYWVDERCVSPDSLDSNYGEADRILLSPLSIPRTQIHRIMGEAVPKEEAVSYAALVKASVPTERGIPVFDYVLLGIGEDGHTSSIFPDRSDLLDSPEVYAVVQNPYDGSFRIALTGKSLINARRTYFLVVGKQKCSIIRKVVEEETKELPASYIFHSARFSELFTAI